MRYSKYLLPLILLALLAACSKQLPGDEGKIIGRWEEAGKKFDPKDSTNSVIWYEFRDEEIAKSYVGDFTYKLDTTKKTVTATSHMLSTDGHTKYKQVFFVKKYVIKKDTLTLSYISRTTGNELKTVLVKRD